MFLVLLVVIIISISSTENKTTLSFYGPSKMPTCLGEVEYKLQISASKYVHSVHHSHWGSLQKFNTMLLDATSTLPVRHMLCLLPCSWFALCSSHAQDTWSNLMYWAGLIAAWRISRRSSVIIPCSSLRRAAYEGGEICHVRLFLATCSMVHHPYAVGQD